MVPGVILAAGASSRMGRPKALLPTATPGETFLSRLVGALAGGGLDDVVIVVGRLPDPDEADLARALDELPPFVRPVQNPDPARGQLSSLQTALAVIDHPGVTGMLVTLIDLPLVTAATVKALVEAHRATAAPIVRPVRQGRHGHPVIFDRALFDALRLADPAAGARALVRAHASRAVEVPVEDEGAFVDVDTPEDYARVFGRSLPGRVSGSS